LYEGFFGLKGKKNDKNFHILSWKNHIIAIFRKMGSYWLPKLGKSLLKNLVSVQPFFIAKCGSLFLWMIANPLYKIGTQKQNPSGNECPPPLTIWTIGPNFGIDKDN
jgi:hypothetical protein